MRRPKIPYPRGKPTGYYRNFPFGAACFTKLIAASCGEFNPKNHKLTKEGVSYIISKYASSARKISTIVPQKVKNHMFRHSKAMHLLQAGVNLIYIRDFLGHVDLKTTEIYARADTEMKRKAVENVYPNLIDSNLPDWSKDQTLLSWLAELK